MEEFRKIKEGAGYIKELELKNNVAYERLSDLKNIRVFKPPRNVTAQYLFELFSNVVSSMPEKEKLEEKRIEAIISFEEKLAEIKDRMLKVKEGYFHDMTDKSSKANVIVGFLAVLELVKQRFLMVEQEDNFGNIKLKKL